MIFLGLGSNLGDRETQLRAAWEGLSRRGVRAVRVSATYETPPWGVTNQPAFLNQVGQVNYTGTPEELLKVIREVEAALGRQRQIRWGARNIDIDLLEFKRMRIRTPELTLPHPHYIQRLFVLVPLAELYPGFVPTGKSRAVEDLIRDFPETEREKIIRM